MEEEYDLAKWLSDEMDDQELESFEKSPGFETYEKIRRHSSQFQAPALDENALYQNVVALRRKRDVKVVPMYRKAIRVAAILVLMLGLGYLAMTIIPTTESASNGKTASFALPDDSQVVLNAGSKISYKKWRWSSNRNLALDGEAYFKVAKGQKFEVSTDLGKVTVLGTQFDVKSRKNRFDVSCYEGRVKVNYNDSEVIITRGQSVAFTDGNAIDVPKNNGLHPEWLDQKLAFNKENLQDIVDELSRQYDVEIELNGVSSAQLFTGVLPMKNLDEALQIIGSIYHLKPQKTNGKIILVAADA
ncbi:MAG: DUF4974 domain-containing protein [Flavobacterium sp.]|nr:MAG: DUF4974 domain-containing protein [Flavobacterium sp.]